MPVINRIRSIIYATTLSVAFLIVGFLSTFLWIDYNQTIDRAEEATRDMAQVLEEYAERTFETADFLADDVIQHVRRHGGADAMRDNVEAHRWLADMVGRTSASDYLMITDSDGVPVALSAQATVARVDLSDRAWFRAHQAGEERHVGEAILSRITEEVLFTYSRRIPGENGEFDGVVQVAMRTSFFDSISLTSRFGQNMILSMIGEDGRIIARTGLPPERIGTRIPMDRLGVVVKGPAGTARTESFLDGVERIGSYRRLDQWPIIVAAAVPVETVLAPWCRSLYWSLSILGVMFLGLAGLTWLGVRASQREDAARGALERANAELAGALASKEVLLKEIHHRIKNNLQVTSGLLQMQAGRFEDPAVQAAFAETQDRMRSIGLIHETLYRNEAGSSIDLADYLGRLAQELAATHGAEQRGIRVVLDLEPLAVSLDRAVPLGLSLTEAITNAFKHAFGPEGGGTIRISARRRGDELEICEHDSGRGLPQGAEAAGSLGLRLIRALVAQLGGRWSLESDNGTVFRLAVPAASAAPLG